MDENSPDNQRLSTATVTCRIDAGDVGGIVARGSLDVLSGVTLDFIAQETILRSEESHGEEDEVGGEELLAAFDGLHVPAAGGALRPLNADGVDALHAVVSVVDELGRHDTVLARVFAHVSLDFGVAVVYAVDARPLGPGIVTGSLWGWLG
jgi:hypothetical protein